MDNQNGSIYFDGEEIAKVHVESYRNIVIWQVAPYDIRRTKDEIVITSIRNVD